MTHPLHTFAWKHTRTSRLIRSSFANLDRKLSAGIMDTASALRLLHNNVRDAARAHGAYWSDADLRHVARLLLSDWRARHTHTTQTQPE